MTATGASETQANFERRGLALDLMRVDVGGVPSAGIGGWMSGIATPAEWDAFVAETLSDAGPSLSASEAARLMQVDAHQVRQMIVDHRLLGVMSAGTLRIPMVQLTLRTEPDRMEIIDGVADVLPLFAKRVGTHAHVYALQYLIHHAPAIDGATPIEALRNGRKKRVIDMVQDLLGLDQNEA